MKDSNSIISVLTTSKFDVKNDYFDENLQTAFKGTGIKFFDHIVVWFLKKLGYSLEKTAVAEALITTLGNELKYKKPGVQLELQEAISSEFGQFQRVCAVLETNLGRRLESTEQDALRIIFKKEKSPGDKITEILTLFGFSELSSGERKLLKTRVIELKTRMDYNGFDEVLNRLSPISNLTQSEQRPAEKDKAKSFVNKLIAEHANDYEIIDEKFKDELLADVRQQRISPDGAKNRLCRYLSNLRVRTLTRNYSNVLAQALLDLQFGCTRDELVFGSSRLIGRDEYEVLRNKCKELSDSFLTASENAYRAFTERKKDVIENYGSDVFEIIQKEFELNPSSSDHDWLRASMLVGQIVNGRKQLALYTAMFNSKSALLSFLSTQLKKAPEQIEEEIVTGKFECPDVRVLVNKRLEQLIDACGDNWNKAVIAVLDQIKFLFNEVAEEQILKDWPSTCTPDTFFSLMQGRISELKMPARNEVRAETTRKMSLEDYNRVFQSVLDVGQRLPTEAEVKEFHMKNVLKVRDVASYVNLHFKPEVAKYILSDCKVKADVQDKIRTLPITQPGILKSITK